MKGPRPRLRPGAVHVWEGRLDAPADAAARARRLLSASELARADRLVREVHRRRRAVAQAHLRRVLGQLTDADPRDIRFRHGRHGKPLLPGGPSFNLSHSGDRVLIAAAREGRLGVDIEEARPVRLMLRLADRKFAPDEAALVRAAPESRRRDVFFRIWTRKEAFLKALGTGLATPLKSFSVDPAPAAPRGLLRAEGLVADPAEWHVGGIACAPGAEAALAADRRDPPIRPLDYDPSDL